MHERKFYRMATEKQKVGSVFKATGAKHLGEDIESLLEANKPDDCLSRTSATFITDTDGVSKMGLPYNEGYLHVVKPIGKLERRDTAWLGELQKRRLINSPHARMRKDPRLAKLSDDEIASKYSAGEASPSPQWEYLASEAVVLEAEDKLRRVRPNSSFFNAFENVLKSSKEI